MFKWLAVAFVAGAMSAYQAQEWRYGAALSDISRANADALVRAHEQAKQRQQSIQAALDKAEADKDATLADIERMRSNPERVYIRATCPAVPAAGDSSGETDAAAARPSDAAVRNYWLLRERVAEVTAQVIGLQAVVKECTE